MAGFDTIWYQVHEVSIKCRDEDNDVSWISERSLSRFCRTPVGWELLSQQFRPGWSCLDLAGFLLATPWILQFACYRQCDGVPNFASGMLRDHGIIRWVTLNPGCRWLRMVKGNLFWMKMEKNGEVLRLAVSKHAWKRDQNCKCMGCCFLKLGLKKKTGSIYPEILVFALGKTRAECHPS